MTNKILTVVGATGTQGGSVIQAVLHHPQLSKEFKIHGLTRDATKPASQALKAKGVEVVEADLNDKASLIKAFKGTDTVFAYTNFWESTSKDTEVTQGKNIADACKTVGGIKHLIWSSGGNASKVSKGKYTGVLHFDSKAEIEEYMRHIGLPVTAFFPARFMSTIRMGLRKGDDGLYKYTDFDSLDAKIAFLDTEKDTGKFVCGIISHRDSLLAAPDGGLVLGITQFATVSDVVAALEKVANKPVKYQEISPEAWKSSLPPAIATELTQMVAYVQEFGYFAPIKNVEKKWEENVKLFEAPLSSFEEYFVREKIVE